MCDEIKIEQLSAVVGGFAGSPNAETPIATTLPLPEPGRPNPGNLGPMPPILAQPTSSLGAWYENGDYAGSWKYPTYGDQRE